MLFFVGLRALVHATEKSCRSLLLQGHDGDESIHSQDIFCINDCGREGNRSVILGSFAFPPTDPESKKPIQVEKKKVKKLSVCFSEESLTARAQKVRGFNIMNFQVQTVLLVTKGALQLNPHDRLFCKGSNRGNVINLDMPDLEMSEEVWRLKVKDKFQLLGNHGGKILVGGKVDSDDDMIEEKEEKDKVVKREKNDIEPMMYHACPASLHTELCHSMDAVAAISAGGDGRLASVCLERKIPFFGLTLTDDHSKALTAFLQKRVFQMSLDPSSNLYNAKLAAVIARQQPLDDEAAQEDGGKGGRKGGKKGKAKGGKKGDKNQKGGKQGGDQGKGEQQHGGKDGGKAAKGGKKGKDGKGKTDADVLQYVQDMARQAAENAAADAPQE